MKAKPSIITDYLEKHFKEKEAKRKQRQMLGAEGNDDLLRASIEKMEQDAQQVARKRIDTADFKSQREVLTVGGSAPKKDEYM